MKKELDDKLCKDFPVLFKDRHGDMSKTLMCWGFNCGDGWYALIYKLCKDLVKIDPVLVVVQVKEKFGGLRFYVGGTAKFDEVNARI